MNDVWTWDFVQSSTVDGRTIRFLNIVDEYTRVCLSIKVGRSITSEDAIDTLAELFSMHGVPKRIRCDNGPEFISTAIKKWLGTLGVECALHRTRLSMAERPLREFQRQAP